MTTKASKRANPDLSSLLGRCFHTFDAEHAIWRQGVVRARVEPGIYLVQHFEWLLGEASTLALVRIEDMLAWQFYETAEHMNFWHEHRYDAPNPDRVGIETLFGPIARTDDGPTEEMMRQGDEDAAAALAERAAPTVAGKRRL